jgi:hypothetical protein
MARRPLPGSEDDQPWTVKALHGRMTVLSGRLDAVEATLGEHGGDLAAIGRALSALRGAAPATTDGTATSASQEDGDTGEGRRDWLKVDDPEQALQWLTEAAAWLRDIGAHHGLDQAPCWPLHPDVVAEVLALADARNAAYTGGPTDPAEWLNRWLPGARDRLGEALESCRGEHLIGTTPYAVSGVDLAAVARWWSCDRTTHPAVPLHAWMRPLDR